MGFLRSALAQLIDWGNPWTPWMFAIFILAVVMGTWTGAVAGRKGRDTRAWFILGFFLPVIGLIVIYILKPKVSEKK
ncbi:MAG: hypothetical protein PHO53_03200 [Actinomycetota bacterium]|nr:hypothetical protein [Actinomycetota bacterium]